MKVVNGKSYNDLSLYFRPENQHEKDAYFFLSLLGRKKTSFVSDLIYYYLKSKGITNVKDITPEYAKLLTSETFLTSTSAVSLPMEVLLKMFTEQVVSSPVHQTNIPNISIPKDVPLMQETKMEPAYSTTSENASKKPLETQKEKPIAEELEDNSHHEEEIFDLSDDDFTMDNNILQGLTAFGVISK